MVHELRIYTLWPGKVPDFLKLAEERAELEEAADAALVNEAASNTNMPAGVLSLLHGKDHRVGRKLVEHPLTKAVAFTGSLEGGRALATLAAVRPEPCAAARQPVGSRAGNGTGRRSCGPCARRPDSRAHRRG